MICCLWVMEMFHIRKQLYSDITVYCWYFSSATCMVLVLHWQQVVICKPLPLAWQCVCSISVTSVLAPCSIESRPRSSALVCMCICWTCPAATSTDVNKTSEFCFLWVYCVEQFATVWVPRLKTQVLNSYKRQLWHLCDLGGIIYTLDFRACIILHYSIISLSALSAVLWLMPKTGQFITRCEGNRVVVVKQLISHW